MSMTKRELIDSLAGWADDTEAFIAIQYRGYWSIEEIGPIVANGRAIQIGVIASKEVIKRLIAEATGEGMIQQFWYNSASNKAGPLA